MSEVSKQIMSREDRGGWRPIDSAPKDADVLLLYGDGEGIQPGYWDDDDDHWFAVETRGLTGGWMKPTHWQPLPPAPDEA